MIEIYMEDEYCYTMLDNIKRNTEGLNEKEILALISSDLRDYFNKEGSYGDSMRFLDSINLLNSINPDFEPSESFVVGMVKLRRRYGPIVDELIDAAHCYTVLNDYYFRLKDEKESWGIIAPPTTEEVYKYILKTYNSNPKKIMK